MKRRFELRSIVLIGALVLVAAFLVSFLRGVGWPSGSAADEGTADTSTTIQEADLRGRVEVLNATTRSGLAADATDRLRDAGFDVVHFGNAETVPDSSAVVDRIGDADIARAVADELGIDRIRTNVDSTLYLDVTVILGVDFELRRR